MSDTDTYLDARTFQHQLGTLADAIAYKVDREGVKIIKPAFATSDIYVMLRQSLSIYSLLFFVNSEPIRKEGYWKVQYSAAILPLIRSMIDCLYNITVILAYPAKGYEFREVGYKWSLEAVNVDEKRYGGDPRWDKHIAHVRAGVQNLMSVDGITADEVNRATVWPTLTRYLKPRGNVPLTPHQEFLKRLTLGFWREYSGISHATFNGLMPIGMFYAPEKLQHEDRENFDTRVEQFIALHVSRAAGLLISMLTEIQAHFRFEGGRINERLHEVWNALIPMLEIKELYDARYAQLMKEKGITPDSKPTV